MVEIASARWGDASGELGRILRFAAAGLANTAIGFGTIAALQEGLGWNPYAANVGGFAVGLTVAFGLGRGFVFRARGDGRRQVPRYLAASGLALALNEFVLALAVSPSRHLFGTTIVAQGAGVASYTLANFILCRFWVFQPSEDGVR